MYRRVFTGTTPDFSSSSVHTLFSTIDLNVETLISMEGLIRYGQNSGFHQIGSYYNSNFNYGLQFSNIDKSVDIYGSSYYSQPYIVILQYTKTTD